MSNKPIIIAALTLSLFGGYCYGADAASTDQSALSPTDLAEEKKFKDLLAQKITVKFENVEFTTVITELKKLAQIDFVLDPAIDYTEVPAVTLDVIEMKLKHVLEYIGRLESLHFVMRHGSVFVSNAKGILGELITKSYDISFLTNGSKADVQEAVEIAIAQITGQIAGDSWKLAGVSISDFEGNLRVTHDAGVHEQIEAYFNSLRAQVTPRETPQKESASVRAREEEFKSLLAQKISVDFANRGLIEVVTELKRIGNIDIIIDPAIYTADTPPVTIKVADMKLEHVVEWAARLSLTRYEARNYAVHISSGNRFQEKIMTRIYDISDLMMESTYAAPQDKMSDTTPEEAPPDEQEFIEIIKKIIAPDSWETEPTLISEYGGGSLQVIHRAGVHEQIEAVLSSLRAQLKEQREAQQNSGNTPATAPAP
jgi:hypothetical protein